VYVYTAATGQELFRIVGETTGTRFGYWGLNGAGDLNQDGFDDFIVGNYDDTTGGSYAGRAYVFFGSAGPFPDTVQAYDADYIMTGAYGALMGIDVTGIDDVNADGFPDFIVGSSFWSWNPIGYVQIMSGQDGSVLFTISGQGGYEDFGFACSAPWDLDGDGIRDLLVGAYDETALMLGVGSARGRVYGFMIGDSDQDQIMSQCDNCPAVYNPDQAVTIYMNGDTNRDSSVTASDIIYMVNFIFKGGMMPTPCEGAGDANCDGYSTASDIIGLVNFVFKSGDPPCDVCEAYGLGWTCP
jgi:hypothetical protein